MFKSDLIPHDNFFARIALQPYSLCDELLHLDVLDDNFLKKYWDNKLIREAIHLASIDLFETIENIIAGRLTSTSRINGIKKSFYQYLMRASTRATPFGLFAGVCLGRLGDSTDIVLSATIENSFTSRLDFDFINKLYGKLEKELDHIHALKYFTNTSLYKIGNEYRYFEEHFSISQKYILSGFRSNKILEKIINRAKSGATYEELVDTISSFGYDRPSTTTYIQKLKDNQVIVSELHPIISGENNLGRIINLIQKHSHLSDLFDKLQLIQSAFNRSERETDRISFHQEVLNATQHLGIKYNRKYLIQTDVLISTKKCQLSKKYSFKTKRALGFLYGYLGPKENIHLTNFKKEFYQRYETKEVPLCLALDADVGISYANIKSTLKNFNFFDEVPLNRKNHKLAEIIFSKDEQKLFNLISKAIREDISEVRLDRQVADFSECIFNDSYCTIQIVQDQEKERILLKNYGGSTAINLVSRFHHISEKFKYLIDELGKVENVPKSHILAEIIHLPEKRTGNVLHRHGNREYEICYLGYSSQHVDHRIRVDDLMLSFKNNKLMIRSKKLNKYVIPILSNAHNYYKSMMPIYRFLCDLQSQYFCSPASLPINKMIECMSYIPRITFQNIIFQKALWKLVEDEVEEVLRLKSVSDQISLFTNYRLTMKIPAIVEIVEGDNWLVINLESIIGIELLLADIRKKGSILIQEHISPAPIVRRGNKYFSNEIVLFF